MRRVKIVGVGMTKFGRLPDHSLEQLAREAIWDAIDDCGLDPRRIGIAYVGNCYAGILQGQESGRAATIVRNAGLGGMAMIHVECGTASASLALHEAWTAVGSGQYDVALAVGVEKLYIPGDTPRSIAAISTSIERFVSSEMGLTPLSMLAMDVERLMQRHGWTLEDLALVAEKNHRLGAMNPRGESRAPLTVDEILNAPRVIGAMTRPMCASAAVDGAGAALVCSEEVARELSKSAVEIAAFTMTGGRWMDEPELAQLPGLSTMNLSRELFVEAYRRAGIGPEDVGLFLMHEAISAEELVGYEVVGLCGPGDGARLIRDGITALDGLSPCNTHGGLIGCGHPVGATGMAQICEAVWQLRGESGDRQVRHQGERPNTAAILNAGAQTFSGGEGVGTSLAMVLKR
jgi:acetyl-CoA acetyltransferase